MTEAEFPILATKDLTKRFGSFVAVNNVSIDVQRGICKGIIGPNGAGKSTFFNLVCGILKPTSGKVLFKGKEISGLQMHEIARRGVGRSFQTTNIFPRLPVLENVRIAVQARGKDNYNFYRNADDLGNYKRKALEILETLGLKAKAFYIADFLTHGDQRKLEIGMALATEPELLLLDEPTAGVSIEEVPDITNVIKQIRQNGNVTILLVEHKIDVIMDICDSVFVMHEGAIIADGSPQEITNNKLVQTVYLGAG